MRDKYRILNIEFRMSKLRQIHLLLIVLLLTVAPAGGLATEYEPAWESLDSRPIPQWYDEAKFGIFIHWGLYSVPAWAPKGTYAEWYWNSLNVQGSPTAQFHEKTYGKDFRYQDFAGMFKAELFDPDEWGEILKRSGAKYVVLTSKHHDGFALFPSKYSWNWNAADAGPHRDLAGDLSKAVKKAGLKMGFYYSLYEWYHPFFEEEGASIYKYLTTESKKKKSGDPRKLVAKYVDEHMLPQMTELVKAYEPSLLWTDGEWSYEAEVWKSREFLAWLFNSSPVKDEIVVNDRWGKGIRFNHGGFYTPEYGGPAAYREQFRKGHKWEECRGIGASFGYNRNESLDDYMTGEGLVHMLADIVSHGGNLLLNIGPTGDGRIPVIMQQRLAEIGEWLNVNGEAIYGSRPWRVPAEGEKIRYTSKGGAVYAVALEWPGKKLELESPKPGKGTKVELLGRPGDLKWRKEGGKFVIEVPPLSPAEAPCRHAFVFRLTGVE